MNLKTFTFLSIGLCVGGALVSVLLENRHWFGIDAGSSWSLVMVIGYGMALLSGFLDTSENWKTRFKYLALSSAVVTAVVAIVLLGGFLLQEVGVPLGWRRPVFDGPLIITPIGAWIGFLILGAVGVGLRFVVRKARATMRRERRIRHHADVAGTEVGER